MGGNGDPIATNPTAPIEPLWLNQRSVPTNRFP
jgi:hypothetical protein